VFIVVSLVFCPGVTLAAALSPRVDVTTLLARVVVVETLLGVDSVFLSLLLLVVASVLRTQFRRTNVITGDLCFTQNTL